jgi:hypothetical protein
LLGKIILESNCLLRVEQPEAPEFCVLLEAVECFCSRIHSWLTVPLGFLQICEILTLDSFIFGAVFPHGFISLLQVTVYGGFNPIAYLSLRLHKRDAHFPLNL